MGLCNAEAKPGMRKSKPHKPDTIGLPQGPDKGYALPRADGGRLVRPAGIRSRPEASERRFLFFWRVAHGSKPSEAADCRPASGR